VAGWPLMAVKTDHPTPSVTFVVFNDCQVVSSLCGCLKHVSNCGLGMPAPCSPCWNTTTSCCGCPTTRPKYPSTSDQPLVTPGMATCIAGAASGRNLTTKPWSKDPARLPGRLRVVACCRSAANDRADLVARRHGGTSVTELVYRRQIQPVVDHGATVMDHIIQPSKRSHSTVLRQTLQPIVDGA